MGLIRWCGLMGLDRSLHLRRVLYWCLRDREGVVSLGEGHLLALVTVLSDLPHIANRCAVNQSDMNGYNQPINQSTNQPIN